MKMISRRNQTTGNILWHMLVAAFSLFLNGFGVYLTIHANIGAGPWDVFNLGLSQTFGILYGTANISVSLTVLLVDVILREPIGIAMIIDTLVVGKTVDLFNFLHWVPVPDNLPDGVLMVIAGLFIIGYTQYLYMQAALGCGPRDTLLVGLKRRITKVPIGVISIFLLAVVTLAGYLLGGPVGPGTLLFAFGAGPIMQFAFRTIHFDPTTIHHQNLFTTLRIFARKKENEDFRNVSP